MVSLFDIGIQDAWILAIGALVATSCALVGVFLVLRKNAMLGDAMSHSVLFGIVMAFLLTGSRAMIPMLIGATLVGLLTAYVTSALHRVGKLQEDASIGVTFTFFFAVGVLLISTFAGKVDLDQDCVLFGEIAFTPFNGLSLLGYEFGPKAFWTLLFVTILDISFVVLGYSRLKILSFDPILAQSLGIRTNLWHYLLMTLVSLTTVAAFESVGAILVVGLLVIPANSAYLIAKTLSGMIIAAVLYGIASVLGGYALAIFFDASISAAITVMSGVLLFLTLGWVGGSSVFHGRKRGGSAL